MMTHHRMITMTDPENSAVESVKRAADTAQRSDLSEPKESKDPVDTPLSDEEEAASLQTILKQTLVALLALGGALALISMYLREPVEELSKWFIDQTGAWGVGLGFFLPDSLTVPIPPDAFLLAGHVAGLPFWQVAVSASVGSILGGTIGFLTIRKISNYPKVRARLKAKMRSGEALVAKYGVSALALAALTPLPYSLICWVCGAMGMRFSTFFLVSLLRIPRVCAYLLFFKLFY